MNLLPYQKKNLPINCMIYDNMIIKQEPSEIFFSDWSENYQYMDFISTDTPIYARFFCCRSNNENQEYKYISVYY